MARLPKRHADFCLRLFVLFMVAVLPSCPESKNPASDPKSSERDESLFGIWQLKEANSGEETKDKLEFHKWLIIIGKPDCEDSPPGLMMGWSMSIKEDLPSGQWFYFFPSQIGQKSIANIFFVDQQDKKNTKNWKDLKDGPFFIFAYALERKRLSIWNLDLKVTRAAIKNGELKGEIKRGLGAEFPTITETTPKLKRYLELHYDKIFREKPDLVFEKVSLEAGPAWELLFAWVSLGLIACLVGVTWVKRSRGTTVGAALLLFVFTMAFMPWNFLTMRAFESESLSTNYPRMAWTWVFITLAVLATLPGVWKRTRCSSDSRAGGSGDPPIP